MRNNKHILLLFCFLALLTLTQCFTNKQNQGQQLYTQHCSSCHMDDGKGLRGVIPPVAQADYLQQHRNSLPCLIRHGINGPIVVNGKEYNQPMPGVETLKTDQITNLLNYIQTHFGNNNDRFTMQQVEQLLEDCPAHQH